MNNDRRFYLTLVKDAVQVLLVLQILPMLLTVSLCSECVSEQWAMVSLLLFFGAALWVFTEDVISPG